MRKVVAYSGLLICGLVLSQVLPLVVGTGGGAVVRVLTMTGLAFIMIHVGFEFHLDKRRIREYGRDYAVAFTAATFPWLFVTGYFVFVMLPPDVWTSGDAWKETLLAGRFAAPTSAGVLFSMLAAAGLAGTWLFRKARVLAIFDDLDTVLLMIPLKMLMVGLAWQLGVVVLVMGVLLAVAYIFLHRLAIPVTWRWVLGYAVAIVAVTELVYAGSRVVDPALPIHIEVLLPAFVLGCVARPRGAATDAESAERALHAVLERPNERAAATVVSAVFMVLVGLSMPAVFGGGGGQAATATITAGQPAVGWGMIAVHVVAVTLLSNLGKMFPVFCYRDQAPWRHRLAVAVGMWPRGEVGAGVLVVSLGFGIGGPIVTVAMLSLALNLVLTGVFIAIARRLIAEPAPARRTTAGADRATGSPHTPWVTAA